MAALGDGRASGEQYTWAPVLPGMLPRPVKLLFVCRSVPAIASDSRAHPSPLLRCHTPCLQGAALTPAQLAERESLVPPPLQRLLRLLGLGGLAGMGPLVAVAPGLASLVRGLPLGLLGGGS